MMRNGLAKEAGSLIHRVPEKNKPL